MADNRIIECMERAQYILGTLMAVKPGEEVLIVVDPQTDERMTQAMAAAALNCYLSALRDQRGSGESSAPAALRVSLRVYQL